MIWGSEWDALLDKDTDGLLVKRMGEVVDGEYQKYTVESGAYVRSHFWGADPRLLQMVAHLSDEQLKKLTLGGHDPVKVFAAYKAAVEHKGQPTVILARTIKGYGIGEAGEGKNITHQQKKLNEDELKAFRTRFGIPIGDDEVSKAPFYRPADDSPEVTYLTERRKQLGGFVPSRTVQVEPLKTDSLPELFKEFHAGSEGRKASTTMAFVRMLAKLLKDPEIGQLVVPIVPDEARTFGMEALFRQVGIYSHVGQLYEPVDRDMLLYYKEAKEGQILEEGITEAARWPRSSPPAAPTPRTASTRSRSSSTTRCSACSASATWCGPRPTPARAGSCSAAPPDARRSPARDCSTRTATSHLLALAVPNLISYDPTFAFEIAVIIEDGIRRMYRDGESVFYYITVMNEQLRDAGHARGRARGHPEGDVPAARVGAKEEGEGTRAAARQRRHPATRC